MTMQPTDQALDKDEGHLIIVDLVKNMAPVRAGFEFFYNFDSGNLGRIQNVQPTVVTTENSAGRVVATEMPDVEFNLWTKPDCFGTEFQNSNRTWFHFGMRANASGLLVKLNLVDLNRQARMYSQGMTPVCRMLPGRPNWERIRDKPTYTMSEDNVFTLSFKYRTPENSQTIVYFAFTYPYSYSDLTAMLSNIDKRFLKTEVKSKDDIYYTRERVCLSLEQRNIDLITISSYHNISSERETRLKDLFPDTNVPRPFRFIGKKVVFVSARVHPGETPSSFVFNGLLNMLLKRDDAIAIVLRRLYVFKMIPMLNPDGVVKGHYRTDTRGVNLNRMYLNPSPTLHPSIFAARSLIRYHHYGYEKEDEPYEIAEDAGPDADDDDMSSVDDQAGTSRDNKLRARVSQLTLEENKKNVSKSDSWCGKWCHNCGIDSKKSNTQDVDGKQSGEHGDCVTESGLFMYLDMHGHASKKGIFMYGNHFEDPDKNVECMLLPKIMSINNYNFHFTACNFTERNMYLKDRRDGMSREGSGRVAVLKLTGLVRSYTLECNYNTGRMVNALPPTIKETAVKSIHTIPVPPKYTPQVYEQVGKAIGASILDLTASNPLTRLPNSQFHNLYGLREWLRTQCYNDYCETRYIPSKIKLRNSTSLQAQGKNVRPVALKTRASSAKVPKRVSKTMRSPVVPVAKKENVFARSNVVVSSKPSSSNISKPPVSSQGSRTKSLNTVKNKIKEDENTVKTPDAVKTPDNSKVLKQAPSKLQAIDEKQSKDSPAVPSKNRIQLKEICYIKGIEGKRVVAKYKTKDSRRDCEDNLIVSWDATNTPHVFSHKTRGPGLQGLKPLLVAGPSKVGCFRVHNFAKTTAKNKRIKRPLQRLATAIEIPVKTDKKRKLLKRSTT